MRYHITALTRWPITVTTELKMSTYLIQINRLAKYIILVLARYVCLVSRMKQYENKSITYWMRMNFLERVRTVRFSLVSDGIKQLNKGEKHLKVTCDNA